MKESKSNWLYVEFGSRGEKEVIEWREGNYKEIKENSREDFEVYKENMLDESDEEDKESVLEYIEEFCMYSSKEGVGVEYSLNEEEGVGYYNESLVRELIGVDLDKLNVEGWKIVENVIDKIDGICFEEFVKERF
jgi:hypothetical protein